MRKNKMPTGAATPMGDEVGRQIKRRKLSVTRIIALFLGVVTMTTLAIVHWPQDTEWIQESRIVGRGDTLWSIAGELQDEGDVRKDVREIIWCIRKSNKLEPNKFLQPGDELIVWKKVLKNEKE